MFNFIVKGTHENGTSYSFICIASSFSEVFRSLPVDKLTVLNVVRSPICH